MRRDPCIRDPRLADHRATYFLSDTVEIKLNEDVNCEKMIDRLVYGDRMHVKSTH